MDSRFRFRSANLPTATADQRFPSSSVQNETDFYVHIFDDQRRYLWYQRWYRVIIISLHNSSLSSCFFSLASTEETMKNMFTSNRYRYKSINNKMLEKTIESSITSHLNLNHEIQFKWTNHQLTESESLPFVLFFYLLIRWLISQINWISISDLMRHNQMCRWWFFTILLHWKVFQRTLSHPNLTKPNPT